MKNKIVVLLSTTLLVMGLVPFAAALVFIKDAFISQEYIYKNHDLNRVLKNAQIDLKRLSKLEPDNEQIYKSRFENIEDLKLIYGEDTFFSDKLNATLSTYFFTGFGLALSMSLLLGLCLSYLINQIYKKAQGELLKQRDRSTYLEEIARWQEVAKNLAHEIRRPLQPIGTWMSNLKSIYPTQNSSEFQLLLTEASMAIDEEIKNLSRMVSAFSNFADLPKPHMQTINLYDFFKNFTDHYASVWSTVNISINCEVINISCSIDRLLLRQILTNLIENAVEANPNTFISVELKIRVENSNAIIDVFNSGITLTDDQKNRMFDLHFTTKHNNKNRGLGLAIVKFFVLEQGGEVKCVEEERGVRFRIKIPLVSGGLHAAIK